MGRLITSLFFGCAMGAGVMILCGCDDGDGGSGKISLDEAVPDPVEVHLGLVTGEMTFDFSASPLDSEDTTEMIQLLVGGTISLTLSDNDTGVEYELSQGDFINAEPDAPGEYQVYLEDEGSTVVVAFFNSFDGAHVQAGEEYTAVVGIAKNDIFRTETFTRAVLAD